MPLIVFSKGNLAGETIAKKLIGNHGFIETNAVKSDDGKYEWKCWNNGKIMMLELSTMHIFSDYLKDYPLFNSGDLIVMLSTHRSETSAPSVSVHSCGNFGNSNKLGGNPSELGHSSGAALKVGLEFLMNNPLDGFPAFTEATHHGPTTLKSPIVWVEIGSSEKEWANEAAAELMANCALEIANKWKRGEKAHPEDKTAIGFGGTHYCAKFSRLMLEEKYELAYVCSKHNLDDVGAEIIRQALAKSSEKIEIALIEKKSMNAALREKIIAALNEANLPYELV
ncbi:MAG: D-aminoacyl-tRNA deacylase [Candidatus Micrarchaeota archaeon]